ncbi:hypothetical protein KCP69_17870 [Salmonella enterica subsp. enterica]|nr:hypothetical protein KCP69_17870 [Salmonella enterica subsp. enterica]
MRDASIWSRCCAQQPEIDAMANSCRATILILLILSMMVLPLPAFISTYCLPLYCAASNYGAAGGDVLPSALWLPHVSDHPCCLPRYCVWRNSQPQRALA